MDGVSLGLLELAYVGTCDGPKLDEGFHDGIIENDGSGVNDGFDDGALLALGALLTVGSMESVGLILGTTDGVCE